MGIFEEVQKRGTQVVYKTSDFNMGDFNKLIEALNKTQQPRQTTLYLDGYSMAIMNNDEVAIAAYKKQHRIDRFRELRGLINKWGIFKAGVIAWLRKNGREGYNNDWTFHDYSKWKYKEISNGEFDSISLIIKLEEDKFSIRLLADNSYGYGSPTHNIILSQNISFKSIINQINYFTGRLEKGAY